ncbi:MAG: DinB family protein [Candidatus Hydrogenedentes bacterium]|nr:DinB family protein [Candidatus Hydrogenedentota bacterium]
MRIAASLISELSYESANTRKLLARVPNEHLGWKPHAKSMTLAHLASHVAEIPQYVPPTVTANELVFDPATYKPTICGSAAEILALHDAAVKDAEQALKSVTDAQMMENWTFRTPTETLFTMPRIAVLRSMVLSHIYHHRGQLTVYLRLKDVPLPALYGPSADEQP